MLFSLSLYYSFSSIASTAVSELHGCEKITFVLARTTHMYYAYESYFREDSAGRCAQSNVQISFSTDALQSCVIFHGSPFPGCTTGRVMTHDGSQVVRYFSSKCHHTAHLVSRNRKSSLPFTLFYDPQLTSLVSETEAICDLQHLINTGASH